MVKITAFEIKIKLLSDDRWLYRGILAIYDRQTVSEQAVRDTILDNEVGFSASDAGVLSAFAEQLLKTGELAEWQKRKARARMIKYATQLKSIAREKSNGVS